jgi:hypothetical protein
VPSKTDTIKYAKQTFSKVSEANGNVPEKAWLGIYQALLWYEKTNLSDYPCLPHIIDADKLRMPKHRQDQQSAKTNAWQNRAIEIERYLAKHIGCKPREVENHMDRLMQLPEFKSLQRQNPLGIAFIGLVHHVLALFGNSKLAYSMEEKAEHVFPGIKLPGRSTSPSIDVLVRKDMAPRGIISVKWSVRHDRINDLTNECPSYKNAASWLRQPLDYIVITNEFDPSRLNKMLGDSCFDAVVHVHKPAVVNIAGLNGRLNQLLDLTDLFSLTKGW